MKLKDGCHIGRQTKEEKNILNGHDESKVYYDLEQPSRDLSAENSPAVVFIFSGEKNRHNYTIMRYWMTYKLKSPRR